MHNNLQMLKKYSLYSLALLGILVLLNSCKKDYETIQSIDKAKIQAYLTKNNLTMTEDPAGYFYRINDPGAGAEVKNADSIYYSYTFASLDGTIHVQTTDLDVPGNYLGYTDQFVVGQNLYSFTAFRDVLSKLKRGGKATLIMPSYLAFGKNGITSLNIPSNEVLLVNVGIYSQAKKHQIDDFMINAFLTKNSLSLTKDPSGAYFNVITPGTGTVPITTTSTITANYTVRYLDGTVVETSTAGAFVALLEDLYKGWQIVLPGRLTKGGKIRLIIPSAIGGGTRPLDFDIEIVEVVN